MATLERGFKSWAERTSLAFRRELGLAPEDPLPPARLAAHLGIALWTPRDVPRITPEITDQLLRTDPWGWSAISFTVDGRSTVIYNPRKSAARRASDIAHELAHFILDHQPATIIMSPDLEIAMRSFDAKQEDEANWLAWCLLLPREALVWASLRRLSVAEIAEHFAVSETLVGMRINRTGVRAQFRAARRRSASSGRAR